jgi:hypothetical protein
MSSPFLKEIQIRFLVVSSAHLAFTIGVFILLFPQATYAQRRAAPGGGQRAVVVDERLAVLRDEPSLSAHLLKRLSRGRKVSLISMKRSPEGVTFYRVAVTRRTRGWLQREAVVSPSRKGDDERLFSLIRASNDFDRVARASIFLETFPRSTFRPAVLLLLGAAAEVAARRLSNEAAKRLDEAEMKANRAATFSYFMNFNGLDRYRRMGIDFVFDDAKKQYHYDGTCWREIVRKFPRSVEAAEARRRLDSLATGLTEKGE